jgi:hypothetical protein
MVCDDALGEFGSFEFPRHYLGDIIDLYLDCASNTSWNRGTNLSPFCRIFLSGSISIMQFSIGEIKAKRLDAYLVLYDFIISRHDTNFYAVHL